MFTIIVSVLVGLAAGGIVHLTLRTFGIGGRLRKSLPVLAAGSSMLFYQLYDEYTWYDRQTAPFGPEMKIIETYNETTPFRPWAATWPYVIRFIAVDTGSVEQNSLQSNLYAVNLHIHKRHESAYEQRMIIDCAAFKRADFAPVAPDQLNWFDEEPEDPLMTAVCGG